MEVDEGNGAAAPHHPVGSNGRIYSAGQKTGHSAGGARRQPARTALLPEKIECLVGQQFYVNNELSMLEIDVPAARALDLATHFALDLGRGHWKSLVRASHRHAEALTRPVPKLAENVVGQQVEIQSRPRRIGKIGDTERPPDSVADFFARRTRTELHLDASHQRAHGSHIQIRNSTAQVADQARKEPWTVLSFEGDFLVVDDDRVHVPAITTLLPACPHGG